MADDLDAFFDEVSAAEAEVVDEIVASELTKNGDEILPPPTKKAKKTNDKPIRPLGVVVAASASSASPAPPKAPPAIIPTTPTVDILPATTSAANVSVPPQPPLPPGPPPKTNKKPQVRTAAGETWIDPTLNEWPENDFRIFVGNLDKIVTDQQLYDHFATKYPSLAKAKVVRDKMGTSKGYGFVSLLKPLEMARAIREMDQTWLSSRPIRTKRSDWKERDLKTVVKKTRNAKR